MGFKSPARRSRCSSRRASVTQTSCTRHRVEVNMATGNFWYEAPVIKCSGCPCLIPLPYPDLPQTDADRAFRPGNTSQLEFPSDEWSAIFGCRECGRVDTYHGQDVEANIALRQSEGRYHNDATCFCVELRCGEVHCKAPATLYVDTPNEAEASLLGLLRASHFRGRLPCGHEIAPIPRDFYKIRRIVSRLW